MVPVQRYQVSIWIYASSRWESAFYVREETVASSDIGAVRNLMRRFDARLVHLAKVVEIRTNVCYWLGDVSL